MITLGVDQSYTSTGYVVNDNGTVEHFGLIKAQGDSPYSKAAFIADQIVVRIITHSVNRVVLEGLAYGMVGNATRDLAGLLFVIITTLERECPDVSIVVVPPTSNKKNATGNGKASKTDMVNALPQDVLDRIVDAGYKKTTGQYDLADAYFLSTYVN